MVGGAFLAALLGIIIWAIVRTRQKKIKNK